MNDPLSNDHLVTLRRSPTHVLMLCSCGWHWQVPRKNALARAAKVRAAISGHERIVGAQVSWMWQPSEPDRRYGTTQL